MKEFQMIKIDPLFFHDNIKFKGEIPLINHLKSPHPHFTFFHTK